MVPDNLTQAPSMTMVEVTECKGITTAVGKEQGQHLLSIEGRDFLLLVKDQSAVFLFSW
jgi:hypothetical protein